MAPHKCCVAGCSSTKSTHKLFCMPTNDNLRNLWMSFLVPTNPELLGLSKNQLLSKRVCERHFDETQFDQLGVRIRYSYPCLFTEKEIAHGIPLATGGNFRDEHNYNRFRDEDESTTEPITITNDITQEHQYFNDPSHGPSIDIPQLEGIGEEETDSQQVTIEQDDFTEMDTSWEPSIQACRVCLALDVKMYDLKDTELGTMFQNITGIVVTESTHSILEHVCWECAARLKAAAVFRHKALLSDTLLQGLVNTGDQIEKSDITLLREKEEYLNSVRVLTSQEVFHIVDIEDETERDLCISHNSDREIENNTEDSFEPDYGVNEEIEEELENKENLFEPTNGVNQEIREELDNTEYLLESNNIVIQETREELENNTEYLLEPVNRVNEDIREEFYEMQIVDEESMMVVPVNTEIEFDSINFNNEDTNIMFLELNSLGNDDVCSNYTINSAYSNPQLNIDLSKATPEHPVLRLTQAYPDLNSSQLTEDCDDKMNETLFQISENGELTEVVSENTKDAVNVEYTYTREKSKSKIGGGIRKKVSTRGKNTFKKKLMAIQKNNFG